MPFPTVEHHHRATEIAILGAGPTGLALALALHDGPWQITVFDGSPAPTGTGDPRALALSEGSRQLLTRSGVWPAATAIRSIQISQLGGQACPTLYADALGLTALGHVARYGDLQRALRQRAEALGITILNQHRSIKRVTT